MTTQPSIFYWTSAWLKAMGIRHQATHLTESTSSLAKAGSDQDPPLMVYLAENQTHGRGRGDHTWTSPSIGDGLLITFSIELRHQPQHLTAPLVGLQVYRALLSTWPELHWGLKPPNDMFIDSKKVGGLLVEALSRGDNHRLLVGFGLNIFSAPKNVEHAACVADFLVQPLKEVTWQGFLHQLLHGIQTAAEDSRISELPKAVALDLTAAIKRQPHYHDLDHVTVDGDLVFPDKTIDWYAL
jgi:biotin-(acetyl-CoA carboxylase) ligase